jgi:hypothetical protein
MVIQSSTGIFSVKSAYQGVQNRSALVELDDSTVSAFRNLWKTNVPLKITIFGWRLLLEKLPTRERLCLQKVLLQTIMTETVSFVLIVKNPFIIYFLIVMPLLLFGNKSSSGWD